MQMNDIDIFILISTSILQYMDFITTKKIIANGGSEDNPIMRRAINAFGSNWWVVKVMAVFPTAALALSGGFTWALIIILAMMVAVVGNNLWQIRKAKQNGRCP